MKCIGPVEKLSLSARRVHRCESCGASYRTQKISSWKLLPTVLGLAFLVGWPVYSYKTQLNELLLNVVVTFIAGSLIALNQLFFVRGALRTPLLPVSQDELST